MYGKKPYLERLGKTNGLGPNSELCFLFQYRSSSPGHGGHVSFVAFRFLLKKNQGKYSDAHGGARRHHLIKAHGFRTMPRLPRNDLVHSAVAAAAARKKHNLEIGWKAVWTAYNEARWPRPPELPCKVKPLLGELDLLFTVTLALTVDRKWIEGMCRSEILALVTLMLIMHLLRLSVSSCREVFKSSETLP